MQNKTTELTDIDPALADFQAFARDHSTTARHIAAMREESIFSDGALPARIKALAAVLWSISARCEPCIRYYVLKARELGASARELDEILSVASTMGGCVGEMWALKAYQAARGEKPDDGACCGE